MADVDTAAVGADMAVAADVIDRPHDEWSLKGLLVLALRSLRRYPLRGPSAEDSSRTPLPDLAALMNPKHFHTPVSTRVSCPVCHQTVYSRSGIHPQCAVRQCDPPRSKAKSQAAPVIDEAADADSVNATSSAESISPGE